MPDEKGEGATVARRRGAPRGMPVRRRRLARWSWSVPRTSPDPGLSLDTPKHCDVKISTSSRKSMPDPLSCRRGRVHHEYFAIAVHVAGHIAYGLYELARSGEVTDSRGAYHRGVSVTTLVRGSSRMYDCLLENPEVGFGPVTYTNDPPILARTPRTVSINAALEVDAPGQIVADALGTGQHSEGDGQRDFVDGTSLSPELATLIGL